jgi:hypothetical protein
MNRAATEGDRWPLQREGRADALLGRHAAAEEGEPVEVALDAPEHDRDKPDRDEPDQGRAELDDDRADENDRADEKDRADKNNRLDQDDGVDKPDRGTLIDFAVCAAFVLFAAYLTVGLWPHPATRALAINPQDQVLDEWFLAHASRIYAGDFTLVTNRLNAPEGINLLSNASLILLGVLLAPITLAAGAAVSFAIAVGVNLAATATGWYLLLARTLHLHRVAAAIGATLCGFGPGIVAQSNSHLHISAQWLVPAIVWCVIRLTRGSDLAGKARLRWAIGWGVLLGLVVTAHVYLGEEVLFLTAVGLGLFCCGYALVDRSTARRALPTVAGGVAVATIIAGFLLVYPLWVQFFGPQSTKQGAFPASYFVADLASFTAISPLSFAGDPSAAALATGPSEYNTFFGLPLLLVGAGIALAMWRRPVIIASAAAIVVLFALSLGPHLTVNGRSTGIWGPYSLIHGLPIIDGALPSRYALAALPLLAVMLATAVDEALAGWGRMRLLVPIAVAAAVVPILPAALPTMHRAPVPLYFTEGYWRGCASRGGVIVPVPPPTPEQPDAMRWAAAANAEFGLPEGFFIGPYGAAGAPSIGIYPRPTSQLLAEVARTGLTPAITDLNRADLQRDTAYWRASCFVLADRPNADALRSTMEQLLGPGERVVDVWVWRVDS